MQLTTFLPAIFAVSALAAPIAPAVRHNTPATKSHTPAIHPANNQGTTPPARDRTPSKVLVPVAPATEKEATTTTEKPAAPAAKEHKLPTNNQGVSPPARDRTPLVQSTTPAKRQNVGSAIVQNNCPFDINLISTSDLSGNVQLVPAGQSYREQFGGTSGAGISIKMSPDDDWSYNLAQFEYTYQPENNQVWYDISFVNGNPYMGNNQQIITGDATCPSPFCAAGDSDCNQAYLIPAPDPQPNWACDPSLDLVYQLC